jgi:thiamine-monophosphate kinase
MSEQTAKLARNPIVSASIAYPLLRQMGNSERKPMPPGGELELLRRIRERSRLRRGGLRLGIGDDCAILRARPGEEIVVTTDLSIDGRHFLLSSHPPESVGYRSLARGLSDLAAMGARPLAAFLSLGLPRELTVADSRRKPWIDRFYDGLLSLANSMKSPLAGGDLAESPLALADIVLVGAVAQEQALLRSGARPGDALYVTGALGGASAGLAQFTRLAARHPARSFRIPSRLGAILQPHLYPQPRIAQGLWLQKRQIASAAIDISDGLSIDLSHLCEESGMSAEVDASAVPVASGATLDQALHGGEDYELLFTARPAARLPRAYAGVPITPIGRIVRQRRPGSPQILLRTPEGLLPLAPRGWEHFSSK